MNQSNKALREEVADLIDEYRIENNERGLGMLDVEPTADQILALVTNHIKDKMPEKNSEEIPPVAGLVPEPMVMANGWAREYQRGYNKALDEVQQIIKEVEEL